VPDKNDDSLIPEWIKNIRDQDELKTAKADANMQRQLLAKKTIETDGPAFWKQLLKELELQTRALAIIPRLRGSLAGIETAIPTGEEARHVAIFYSGLVPQDTSTNIFYKPGQSFIRCHTQEGDAINFQLFAKDRTIYALDPDDGLAMDAEQCATKIIQPMVLKVRADAAI